MSHMKQLTTEQRYQIEAYLKTGMSKRKIAIEINVHFSTIYREINRNSKNPKKYSAFVAKEWSRDRKDRFTFNRKFTKECEKFVIEHLKLGWSPEQIVGWCKVNAKPMVSIERIYQYVRKDKAQGGKIYTYLRHKLKHRKRPVGKHFPIANRVPISQRPEIVDAKERFGDWEMDTIIGAGQLGAILTLTERTTNYIAILKLPNGKNAIELAKILVNFLLPFKKNVHTLTTDNGPEFADHLTMCQKLEITVYFTNPYCSWEKGSIENANKLIRQYIPKEADLTKYSQAQLTEIQQKINARPRKKLNFEKPKNIFYNFVEWGVAFRS